MPLLYNPVFWLACVAAALLGCLVYMARTKKSRVARIIFYRVLPAALVAIITGVALGFVIEWAIGFFLR